MKAHVSGSDKQWFLRVNGIPQHRDIALDRFETDVLLNAGFGPRGDLRCELRTTEMKEELRSIGFATPGLEKLFAACVDLPDSWVTFCPDSVQVSPG